MTPRLTPAITRALRAPHPSHRLMAMAILLGACAPEPPAPPVADAQFISPNQIVVEAIAGLHVREAFLLDDRNQKYFAADIEEVAGDQPPWRPGVGVHAYGGPRSGFDTGLSIGIPLTNPFRLPAPRYSSRTTFEIGDLPRYHQHWRAWRIRLEFGDNPTEQRLLEIDAPPPS